MKLALAICIALHGAIHVLGFVKAFGLAQVPQIAASISRPLGVTWLVAALSHLAAALLLVYWPERWPLVGLVALATSQVAIIGAWSDAKLGTIPNVIVLVPLMLALLDQRSSSFRSIYHREVERGLARATPVEVVTESDLAPLPGPLQTYLRRAGVVGRPRVQNLRARWRGQMRNGKDAPWMDIRAEQVELFDDPTRLFYMKASLHGIPFEGLHVYSGASATMRVRVVSLFDIVDARGPEMNRSETVTLFNDMCLLAPASLVGAPVTWRLLDALRVRGTFTNAGNTISAELLFDSDGDLVDFVSHDRDQSPDGKTFHNFPWSTPVRDYKDFGGARLAAHGDAVWREPSGDFLYARFELEEIEYNVAPGRHHVGTTAGVAHVFPIGAKAAVPGEVIGQPGGEGRRGPSGTPVALVLQNRASHEVKR